MTGMTGKTELSVWNWQVSNANTMLSPSELRNKADGASALLGALSRRLWTNRALRVLLVVSASSGALSTAALAVVLRDTMCNNYAQALGLLVRLVLAANKVLMRYVVRGFRPELPHWTLRFEIVCALIRVCTRRQGTQMIEYEHARNIRAYSESFGSFTGWFARRAHQRTLETVHYNGLEHLWLRSPIATTDGSKTERIVVMFVHGGAFAILSPRLYMSFCCALTHAIEIEIERKGGCSVAVDAFVANYRKAPENPFPTPPQDVVLMYDYLLTREGLTPSQIVLAGDSAGASLALSALIRVRNRASESEPKQEPRLPLATVLICPAADMTDEWNEDGDSEHESPHCIISHKILAAGRKAYHRSAHDESLWHDASAVHSDLSGLPPVLIQAGEHDLLYPHAARLFEKGQSDGAVQESGWVFDPHEHMPHVFTVFPTIVLPYAHVGVQRLAAFVAKQVLAPQKAPPSIKSGEGTASPAGA
jgi:acetyl esterase/lipase